MGCSDARREQREVGLSHLMQQCASTDSKWILRSRRRSCYAHIAHDARRMSRYQMCHGESVTCRVADKSRAIANFDSPSVPEDPDLDVIFESFSTKVSIFIRKSNDCLGH